MSEWEETTLGELINFTTGKLNSNAAVLDGKYPFFTCSPETLSIDTYAFDCKAILLAGNNANGKYPIKLYDGKFNAYQRTYVITPKNENNVDIDYLYYLLSIRLNYFRDISQGSATKFLTAVILRNLFLKLPSINEQKEIAAVLSCLDRKIENLRKQNETLEKIAQTLFKHWFVDFEFPFDFAQGKPSTDGKPFDPAQGKPYRSSGGAMVPSELGEIPAGWRVGTMKDVIEVRDGTHESPKQTEEGFHLITSKHLKKEGIDFESAYLISETDYLEANKRSRVHTFDTLLSMIGTVGLLYFVMEKEINFAIKNIGLFKSSRNPNYSEFIFLFLTSTYGRFYFRTRMAGTTQSYITLGSLREMPLLIPNECCLIQFREIIQPIFKKAYSNREQIQTLTKTRDALLPKLMSGKLRVGDNQHE
ncbi:MAG: restriction endonuclease subunit S [Cyanobacteria bacterium J06627_28]